MTDRVEILLVAYNSANPIFMVDHDTIQLPDKMIYGRFWTPDLLRNFV